MIYKDKEMILNFLNGSGEDHLGRKYQDILAWSNAQLEDCHDQIQWIFPLHEESSMAENYPILTPEIVNEAKDKGNEDILWNLTIASNRFKRFLGIGAFKDAECIERCFVNGNHNLLRVTRIIRCLRLFGLDYEAILFYREAYMVALALGIDDITLIYWNKARFEDPWETLR